MDEEEFYLKPNVVFEPLVDNWYAWSHLISPATAALNITERHLKIMNSYIQAPQLHAQAVRNPKMRGGPFMDLGGERVSEITELRDFTLSGQGDLIELAKALKNLSQMLKSKVKSGFSLEPLYSEIPAILKGYVELIYDLNNQASFRIFESLLYKSRFFKISSQSLGLWLTDNDERPFVLSTPRLPEDNVLRLNIPFSDPLIDQLSKMKRTGVSKDEVRNILKLDEKGTKLFSSFFTNDRPPIYQRYSGERVRMRYFGHACILIETKDISILIDPVVSYYGYVQQINRYSDMDLPEQIDYVLITHNHQDHILFETLLPLRHKIKNLVIPKTYGGSLQDPSLRLMFQYLQFRNVIEIGELDQMEKHDCVITGIPFLGEHCDLNIQAKICYHLRIGNFSMLFLADSNNIEPRVYHHVKEQIGNVDVIFLGMECDGAPLSWLYGPLLSEPIARDKDSSRRLSGSNFERGKTLIETFEATEVYVYAMGQEPWIEFISSIKYTEESNPIIQSDKLIEYFRGKNIIAERLFGEKEILYNKD